MAHNPRERLNHLLELAGQGAAGQAALFGELAELLLDWPADYAQAMRAPFETLLQKTAREVDAPTRAALAQRLRGHDELPVCLLNEFFLDAPCDVRARILARNEMDGADSGEPAGDAVDGAALVGAARTTNGAFAETFAAMLSLPQAVATEILADETRQALAIACKGAGIDRAAFSAIAVLADPTGTAAARLAAFDAVPQAAADRLTRLWRARG